MGTKIDNASRIEALEEKDYKKLFGIKRVTFERMLEVLEKKNAEERVRGGKTPTLSILDRLVITLMYWREYRNYENIAFDYGVKKSVIGKHIIWVENVLIKCGMFNLPSKRELLKQQRGCEVLIVDVTEQEIERPTEGQKQWYSGKKTAYD